MEGQDKTIFKQVAGGNASTPPPRLPSTDTAVAPIVLDGAMNRGWVKSWRCSVDHEVSRDPNAFLILHHLLWAARRFPQHNRRLGVVIERGQCDLTQDQLCHLTGLTRKEVRAAIGRLVRYETVSISHVKGQGRGRIHSVITIVNYERYQQLPSEGAENTDAEGPAKGHKRASLLEVEKVLPSPDKPVRKVKPHWGETLIKPFLDLPGAPKGGPWSYLNKVATEYARPNVEAALRQAQNKRFDTWGHLCGWLVEVAKRAGKTAPAQEGPSW